MKLGRNQKFRPLALKMGPWIFFWKAIFFLHYVNCKEYGLRQKSPPFPQILTFWPLFFANILFWTILDDYVIKDGGLYGVRGPIFENVRFLGGQFSGPLPKKIKFSKMGPLTPFNTPFLLHNHVVWSKIGCL